jgi:antitoxin (DNA-binding transcriptional repressor) of toxin-antitoxin stability system
VRVTLRGRPLADIVPASAAAVDDRLRELIASGRLVPPARARPGRAPRLAKGTRTASSLVLSEREAER